MILSTVIINVAMGENGLLAQARQAKELAEREADEEDKKTSTLGGSVSNLIEGVPEMTVSYAKDNNLKFDTNTKLADDLRNVVTVPGGFHIADDSGVTVEEGIVIEDNITGDQFVWIPVGTYNVSADLVSDGKLTNNLSRRIFEPSGATEVQGDNAISTDYYGEGNENSVAKEQIEQFKDSANKNAGFYIGRYEAGTEEERTNVNIALTRPLAQKDKYPYIYITRDQARMQSEAMYSGNEYVTSELMSSYAWDTALNFICQTNVEDGEGIYLAGTQSKEDTNINTGEMTKTGEYTADNYSNIFDFLGNNMEFNTEYSNNKNGSCVIREGSWANDAGYSSFRYHFTLTEAYPNCAFRVQLYIKDEEMTTPTTKYTDIYVTRYSDGTLGFCSTDNKIIGKTIAKEYGNIKGINFTVDTATEETNTPWFNDREKIKSIEFVDEIVPYSTSCWFAFCTNLKEIRNIENLNTSEVVNMLAMFASTGLEGELDLSTFNTSKVTNMDAMFFLSTLLNTITLGENWDTSNVTSMASMFGGDTDVFMNLSAINGLEYLDTSNVQNMRAMFAYTKFKELDLTNFNTSKVIDVQYMFASCGTLKTIKISNEWNIDKANQTGIMDGCNAEIKVE